MKERAMKPRRLFFRLLLLTANAVAARQYVISTYAGGPPPPGANTSISVGPVTTDASGNVYFTEGSPSCVCVFKLDPNGVLTRIAGSAQRGFSGDGGPAGRVYIADSFNNVVRMLRPIR
jgi:hypothetical protein